EVAGESAKPALGADGTRVPLLRPGFRPNGPYAVSFVYLHAGTPFAKKGDLQMTLPKMDVPVGIVEWEVFVPENYSARAIDGNVLDRRLSDRTLKLKSVDTEHGVDRGQGFGFGPGSGSGTGPGVAAGVFGGTVTITAQALPGQIRGRATDSAGANLPGVSI